MRFNNRSTICSSYDFQLHQQRSQRRWCFSETAVQWFDVLPGLSALPGVWLSLPGLSPALLGAPRRTWRPLHRSSKLWDLTTLGFWSDNSQTLQEAPRDQNTICGWMACGSSTLNSISSLAMILRMKILCISSEHYTWGIFSNVYSSFWHITHFRCTFSLNWCSLLTCTSIELNKRHLDSQMLITWGQQSKWSVKSIRWDLLYGSVPIKYSNFTRDYNSRDSGLKQPVTKAHLPTHILQWRQLEWKIIQGRLTLPPTSAWNFTSMYPILIPKPPPGVSLIWTTLLVSRKKRFIVLLRTCSCSARRNSASAWMCLKFDGMWLVCSSYR